MKELPDFLSDEPSRASEPTPAPEPAAQPEPQPTPEASQGQPRDEKGKFAPIAAQPAPDPAPQPAPQPEPQPVAHSVPLPTFLEMRDKLTHTEGELKRLTEWREQQEAQARRQPVPDPEQDPDGYRQYERQTIDEGMFVMRRDFSRQFAVQTHGQEAVDAAWKWGVERCDADPHFNAKVRSHPDPAGFVVSEWKRDQVASKVDPTEYDAFLAWKAAGGQQAALAPAPQPAPTPAPAAPRPSLAAAPSAGASASVEAVTGEERFSRMFP